ncbi:MBL fold metallo-hydrolase [Pseudomonas sp. SDO5522_S412]
MTKLTFTRVLNYTALAAALALGAIAAPAVAVAAAPQVKTQAPGYYRTMLGDFEVTALSDGTIDAPFDKLLNEPAAKTTTALRKAFLGVPTETSTNAYLVNTGTRLILIDTGAGALFGPTLGKLAANLQAAGYKPDQVDDILLTHMHPDHVGGLVAEGVMVFPNATVHADKRDADYWLSPARLEPASADANSFVPEFAKGAMASLNPYIALGKFQPFQGSGEILPGFKALSSYGHTLGHTSYLVESKGQKMIVAGDLIHAGAVQFADPSVTIEFDTDKKAATTARETVFSLAAKEGALVGAAHLSFPGLGHLRGQGAAWQWVPLNYSTELK